MNKVIVLIEGPDAETALAELLANAEYDKLNVVIWVADNPVKVEIETSSLAYASSEGE